MSFVDSLYPLVITGDVVVARDLLAGLKGTELSDAKAWFAKATRSYGTIPAAAFDDVNNRGALRWRAPATGAGYGRLKASQWIMALCAVELCGPATAARRVPWDNLWEPLGSLADRLFIDALCAKDVKVCEAVE